MEDFNEALNEIFGDTEWEVLEKNYYRGFYTPDGIRTESSRSTLSVIQKYSQNYQNYENDK